MSKAVRFDQFGHVDVLNVVEVEKPSPSPGRILVRVITAGTNPGEIAIREGQLEQRFSTTFPCGEGTDFAGSVAELGDGVTSPAVGTAVMGWSNERSAQAEFVSVPADQVIVKPESLSWEVAGALFVVAATAWAAVAAVAPQPGGNGSGLWRSRRRGSARDAIGSADWGYRRRHGGSVAPRLAKIDRCDSSRLRHRFASELESCGSGWL